MTTSPAERDPQALTDRDGLAKVIRGAMMTAYEDGKGGWLFRASTAHEIADAVLSARPAATTEAADAVDNHLPIAAGPAMIMCHCDMERRDVPSYRSHLRAALATLAATTDTTWLCAKCGHGRPEHSIKGHVAFDCVADMRLVPSRAATTDTAAQALRDAADEMGAMAVPPPKSALALRAWLYDRADRLDPGTRTAHHDTGHHGEGA